MAISSACSDALLRSSISTHYRLWQHKISIDYSYMLSRKTLNPVYSLEWLPDKTVDKDGNVLINLLIGEAAMENSRLIITRWKLQEDLESQENPADMEETWSVSLPSDLNRVRHMPQLSSIAALQCTTGLFLYSLRSTSLTPTLVLQGQRREGFGLEWNPGLMGMLVSGGYDRTVRVWDVQMATALNRTVRPVKEWEVGSEVEDVSWSPNSPTSFLASTHSGHVLHFDSRISHPLSSHPVHSGPCYSLSFNSLQPTLLSTSGSDHSVSIWDLRMQGVRLSSFQGHQGEVGVVRWAPFSETILVSGGKDRVVKVWNASGKQDKNAVFTHEGHISEVTDIAWHPSERLLLASSSLDSIQLWALQGSVLGEDS